MPPGHIVSRDARNPPLAHWATHCAGNQSALLCVKALLGDVAAGGMGEREHNDSSVALQPREVFEGGEEARRRSRSARTTASWELDW